MLLGVGLLGVLTDQDLAVENRAGAARQNALVQLVAGGVRLGVIDGGVIIDVLLARDQIQAVERAFAALREHGVDVVADKRAAEG